MRPCSRALVALLVGSLCVPAARAAKHAANAKGDRSVSEIEQYIEAEAPNLDPETRAEVIGKIGDIFAQLPQDRSKQGDFIRQMVKADPSLGTLLPGYLAHYLENQARTVEPTPTKTPLNGPINAPDGKTGVHPQLPSGWELGLEMAQDRWRQNPTDPHGNQQLGAMYYLQHEWRGAWDRFNDAYNAGGRDPQMVANMAGAAYELGDYASAARAAREALALDPGNKEALTIYQFSKDRVPKVRLPSALPDFSTDRTAGSVPEGANAPVAAGAPAGGVVAAPPPSGMTAQQVADLAKQAAAGGPSQLARSAQFTKDAANALRVRDYPVAYQLASDAIVLNPQNAQALNYRAMSLSQMRRYSDAVQDASAALGLAPGSAAVLQTRSWAFAKQGKYKEALVDAEATLSGDPNNAFALENKAFAQAGLGDREGAHDSLRRAAAIDPRFSTR
ncbi:MAG: tetratricopeptide repeat protein, partial [Elusimicrobia bacterium]|nr:tetratricopeptide repeat protein [Elusimicrobiota bacterium]